MTRMSGIAELEQSLTPPAMGRIAAFLFYGNLPVGGIAVCFMLGTYALLRLQPDVPLLLLAFFGTFLVYQFERALHPSPEDAFNHPARLAWSARHRRYVWISSVVALAGALATLPFLRPATLGVGAALGVLSGFYMLPVGAGRRRLKSIWYLKPLTIAGAWAVGGVVLPVIEAGTPVTLAVVAFLGYRLLFVLPNALLADWPDRYGDAQVGLSTFATRYDLTRIQQWIGGVLFVGFCGGVGVLVEGSASWLLGVDLLGLGLMAILTLRPLPHSRWFFGFVLDAIVAWPIVTAACAWGTAG